MTFLDWGVLLVTALWGSCTVMCLVIGYQEYRHMRREDRVLSELDAAFNGAPLSSAVTARRDVA